jgi:[ribosomal protein S18]-alanine N-acetyltransferase
MQDNRIVINEPKTFCLRLAAPSDAIQIAALSREYIEQGLPWRWKSARILKAMKDPNTNVLVAAEQGMVLGFGIMDYKDETAHLILFAVHPCVRRLGVGSQMLQWLEAVALAAGISKIGLEAKAANQEARGFYVKHGYSVFERVAGMYLGVEDGVRLGKYLRH